MDGAAAKAGELVVPSWHCCVEGLRDIRCSFQNHLLTMREREGKKKERAVVSNRGRREEKKKKRKYALDAGFMVSQEC